MRKAVMMSITTWTIRKEISLAMTKISAHAAFGLRLPGQKCMLTRKMALEEVFIKTGYPTSHQWLRTLYLCHHQMFNSDMIVMTTAIYIFLIDLQMPRVIDTYSMCQVFILVDDFLHTVLRNSIAHPDHGTRDWQPCQVCNQIPARSFCCTAGQWVNRQGVGAMKVASLGDQYTSEMECLCVCFWPWAFFYSAFWGLLAPTLLIEGLAHSSQLLWWQTGSPGSLQMQVSCPEAWGPQVHLHWAAGASYVLKDLGHSPAWELLSGPKDIGWWTSWQIWSSLTWILSCPGSGPCSSPMPPPHPYLPPPSSSWAKPRALCCSPQEAAPSRARSWGIACCIKESSRLGMKSKLILC